MPYDAVGSLGWTLVVPANIDNAGVTDYLFYNATSGRTVMAIGSVGGGFSRIALDSVGSAGWTSIVPANIDNSGVTDYVFYNVESGRTLMAIGSTGGGFSAITYDVVGSAGWTSVVPGLTHPLIPPTPCDTSQDSKEVSEERLFA